MTTHVTNGTLTFFPTVVDGYESARETATVVHQILDRANPDVTIRPAGLRTGTLRLVFANPDVAYIGALITIGGYVFENTDPNSPLSAEQMARACEDAHAQGGVFTLMSTDRYSIEMSYVANGTIARSLDEDTRQVWIVEIDFHEVVLG